MFSRYINKSCHTYHKFNDRNCDSDIDNKKCPVFLSVSIIKMRIAVNLHCEADCKFGSVWEVLLHERFYNFIFLLDTECIRKRLVSDD